MKEALLLFANVSTTFTSVRRHDGADGEWVNTGSLGGVDTMKTKQQ